MKKMVMLAFLLNSVALHASCGELDIQIINNSSHTCTFKNKVMYFGVLPTEAVPAVIAAHESSPTFTASQDNVGIGVLMTYNCDNEVVQFYSYQEYCGIFGAGAAGGQPQNTTTLNLDYEVTTGSLFTGRPGKIIWKIS